MAKSLWWLKWVKRPDVPPPIPVEGLDIVAVPEEPATQPVDYHDDVTIVPLTDVKPINEE